MTVEELREKGWILLEVVSGSHAYGLATEHSDVDIRGVYQIPTEEILKDSSNFEKRADYYSQISDKTNDVVFYEISKFIGLLEKGNPNILELLATPQENIIYKSPLWDKYFPDNSKYITKKLQHSFLGYAHTQIEKAKGLNKKIRNKQPKERKDILDFCSIIHGNKMIPFWEFMFKKCKENTSKQDVLESLEYSALCKLDKGVGLYILYPIPKPNPEVKGGGILKDLNSTELKLSSIPKGFEDENAGLILSYNLNGFQVHCKEHREYWEWVEKRNPQRYLENKNSKTEADVKNLMHCVRLVEMAHDIATKEEIIVRRPNRKFLLSIRKGEYDFDEIMNYVEDKIKGIKILFNNSKLIDKVDINENRELLKEIRLNNLKNE